ncbi:L-rhamnose-binding lectin CSL3-like [Enoplosus armatus]|uniref:L-rhamnose-binding lectin CSL3-like n=1 Tax=Enoplosus armatus TaxID=215367 RepID=UPI003992D948
MISLFISDKMLSTRLTVIAFLAAACCSTSDGNYDVACPGVNNELKCPEGHVIEVQSIQHGVKSDADCAARSQPAKVSEKNCFHRAMTPWAKLICDNMGRCRLPKPHVLMFVCDYSKDAFIQYTFVCRKKSADVQTAVICGEQTADIKCEKGVLDIVKASFGRLDEKTCTDTPSKMTFCTSFTADGSVKEMCNGKKLCNLTASPDNLGQPVNCDKHPKYLTVDYVCQ